MKKILTNLTLFVLMASMALAIPSVGTTGTDTTYGSYAWEVCRSDATSAWVTSGQVHGQYNPTIVCQELGYNSVETWGGTCGTTCGRCDADYSGTEVYDGNGANFGVSGAVHLGYTVHWKCSDYVGGNDQGDEVPEFGVLAAIGILGVAGIFLYRKRQ